MYMDAVSRSIVAFRVFDLLVLTRKGHGLWENQSVQKETCKAWKERRREWRDDFMKKRESDMGESGELEKVDIKLIYIYICV